MLRKFPWRKWQVFVDFNVTLAKPTFNYITGKEGDFL